MFTDNQDKESFYPSAFRRDDFMRLVDQIKLHHSIELVGMKRVGINNFLRFFLHHRKKYLENQYFIIMVDFVNLYEREIYALWRLTLKRINDVVKNSPIQPEIKTKISHLFDISIQTNDMFITFDGILESIHILVENHYFPVIIFNRFDRLKDVVNSEFYDNLIAIKNASHDKLSYIFTSYRELEELSPDVFTYTSSSGFSQIMYIQPVNRDDAHIVVSQITKQYGFQLDIQKQKQLLDLCGGHIQYLRLSLLCVHDYFRNKHKRLTSRFFSQLKDNERITLQSEELWESISPQEQEILKRIILHKRLNRKEKIESEYLEKTGYIVRSENSWQIFSPLFTDYVTKKITSKTNGLGSEFTKQENRLFSYLQKNENHVCERDEIIAAIWPESNEWGASDWSLDKLVARTRVKLKRQESDLQVITVRTRGYKLVKVNKKYE